MSRMTQDGQVKLPLAVRRKLRLRPGDGVRFRMSGETILVEKAFRTKASLRDYLGFLGHLEGREPDALVTEMRGGIDPLGD